MSRHNIGITILGAADTGFNWQGLVSAAAEAANTGITYAQQKSAKEQADRDSATKAQAAIDADAHAVDALAAAQVALPGPAQDAARLEVQQAVLAEDAASAGLSPDAAAKRLKAAQDSATKAASEYSAAVVAAGADPKNATKQSALALAGAKAKAWATVITKAQAWQMVQSPTTPSAPTPPPRRDSGSWWTRPVAGPVPGWGVAVGGGLLTAGLGWLAFGRR